MGFVLLAVLVVLIGGPRFADGFDGWPAGADRAGAGFFFLDCAMHLSKSLRRKSIVVRATQSSTECL